jgi:hypothetical protein
MRQQFLPVPPHQLLSHLRLELNLYRLKILHPALWGDEGVIRTKQEADLQARGGLAQQSFWNGAW